MKNPQLKQKFLDDWIPTLQRMLDKEDKHCNDLEMMFQEVNPMFTTEFDLSKLIDNSYEQRAYLLRRIEEYKAYVENL